MSEKNKENQKDKKDNAVKNFSVEEKIDYGKTLNLPKTEFSMRGNLPKKEPEILEAKFESGLYEKMLKQNEGKKPFVLHDGPPYANGDIHIGHALNKILKDTIVRYKHMKGFYSPYIPGYDTHGLPTEIKAIEALKLDRDEIPVDVFRDTCKDFAEKYVHVQTDSFKRLGVLGDWDNPYITYQREMEIEQINVFADMYFKDFIYQGLKPVYWCTSCETALAEAEIEYKDISGNSIYVKFPITNTNDLFDKKDSYAIIWTTTPWTLPGNTAITAGPDFTYSLVGVEFNGKKEKYILLSNLVESLMKTFKIEEYDVIKQFKAKELVGIEYKHPFLDRKGKLVLGSKDTVDVDSLSGTGLVHTAPGYGKEDYALSLKEKLDMIVAVDEKGHQTKEAGPFEGMYYKKADKEIIKYLQEKGLLLAVEDRMHSYPHCWRCKSPIIFKASKQWFASINGFRQETLKAIKTVEWFPKWGEDRITKMVEDRNDWCISRQRTWGVPLPILYCKKCEKPHVTKESIERIKQVFKEEGTNSWWMKDASYFVPENAQCECGHNEFKTDGDIMDVWFDSGSTHRSVVKLRGLPKADVYLEGNDQYRGWFQSSLLTSVATTGKAPYKQVVTNGFLVDQKGHKMSKSLGNVVVPSDVIERYGADILRLWVISSEYQSDISISEDILKQVAESYRKIRNTARYILGNISDLDPNKLTVFEDLEELDKWAIYRLNRLIGQVTRAYDSYEFNKAYNAINQFIVSDMSTFYLDAIKDRLYVEGKTSDTRKAAQSTIYRILHVLVRLLAPIISFTAEEIWDVMPHIDSDDKFSVMLAGYPVYRQKYSDVALGEKIEVLQKIREVVLVELEKKRKDKIIGGSLDAKVELILEGENFKLAKENKKLLKEMLIVSELKVSELKEITQDEDGKDINIKAIVSKAIGDKCERCWMYTKDVGEDKKHSDICLRCANVLNKM